MKTIICLQITAKVSSNWYFHFRCVWPGMAKLTKITTLLFVCNILRQKWALKLIFCMQINIIVSYKLISTLWTSKFPPRWYYHYWWTWSSIPKVLKVTILQYLFNISKKKLGMEFIFWMQINIKVSTSWGYCFWWKWLEIFKVPKIGNWLYFCNTAFKKKVLQPLLCSIVMHNIEIFYGCAVMFVVTCFIDIE